MVDYNHPNSPYYDDSWENIEVWRVEAVENGEVVDCWLELEDDVNDAITSMQKEYPTCEVRVICCSILDCPQAGRNEILQRIENNRQDYEDISFWRNYV